MKFTGERFQLGGSSNRTKADAIVKYLFASFFTRGKVVLDIASGSGFGTFFLAQESAKAIGVDISQEAVGYAKDSFCRSNLVYEYGDAANYVYPEKYFDVIVSFQTIEHLNEPNIFLESLGKALKDDGMIVLGTPNKKIVSPFTKEPIGEFHKFEFYKKDLEKMFEDKFQAKWYGQRCTFKPLAWWLLRRSIRFLEIILNYNFGFYGVKESYQIKPLKFWHEPKDFIIILTKK